MISTSAAMLDCAAWAHGFTGRSGLDGADLNLGSGATGETWTRAAEMVGMAGAPVATASQVHGRTVLRAHTGGLVGEGDALITDTPGLLLAIRVADCVPIVVAGDGAVAVIHAGWRGLAAGIISATLTALGPGRWTAAVGPRICVDCYEVGEEVVDGIAAHVPVAAFVRREIGPRPHVDLGAAAAHQLGVAGVQAIDVLSCCTRCSRDHWSYRQEGLAAGRQAGLVGLRC